MTIDIHSGKYCDEEWHVFPNVIFINQEIEDQPLRRIGFAFVIGRVFLGFFLIKYDDKR